MFWVSVCWVQGFAEHARAGCAADDLYHPNVGAADLNSRPKPPTESNLGLGLPPQPPLEEGAFLPFFAEREFSKRLEGYFDGNAAAKEVGNLNHCRLCDGPLPQDQLSCLLECRADIDGDVLGLRFAQALLPAFVPKDVDEALRDLSTGNLVQEREDGQFTAHLLVRG